jgi:hypothetical protein
MHAFLEPVRLVAHEQCEGRRCLQQDGVLLRRLVAQDKHLLAAAVARCAEVGHLHARIVGLVNSSIDSTICRYVCRSYMYICYYDQHHLPLRLAASLAE